MIRKYRYAEIGRLYVDQLAHVWVGDSTDAIRIEVEEKLPVCVMEGLKQRRRNHCSFEFLARSESVICSASSTCYAGFSLYIIRPSESRVPPTGPLSKPRSSSRSVHGTSSIGSIGPDTRRVGTYFTFQAQSRTIRHTNSTSVRQNLAVNLLTC